MIASLIGGDPNIWMDIAAVICGVALLYLVLSRTMKRNSDQ
jgi:hypothetical protein